MNTTTMVAHAIAPDLATVKIRQQAAWATGDYAVVGTTLQIVGEQLCEAMDIGPADTVLDVAAGNGNATLAAARRGAAVTSTDYVPALLDNGRKRAVANGLNVARLLLAAVGPEQAEQTVTRHAGVRERQNRGQRLALTRGQGKRRTVRSPRFEDAQKSDTGFRAKSVQVACLN